MLKLGKICERKDFTNAAEKTLRLMAERLQMQPQAVPKLLLCLDFSLDEPKRVVIAGPERNRLLLAAHQVYQPNKVVLGVEGPVEPFAKTLPAKEGPVVYLCTGTACQPPTSDPENVKGMLK